MTEKKILLIFYSLKRGASNKVKNLKRLPVNTRFELKEDIQLSACFKKNNNTFLGHIKKKPFLLIKIVYPQRKVN